MVNRDEDGRSTAAPETADVAPFWVEQDARRPPPRSLPPAPAAPPVPPSRPPFPSVDAPAHAPAPTHDPGGVGPVAAPATAAAFTSETMLKPRAEAPSRGWRRAVFRLSAGRVNPGLSAAEVARGELVARVRTPVAGARRVAVISRKGGVGKTTTALMLGHTFAEQRGDRVVALDGNPDAGSLGYRVPRETTATITNLLADADRIQRYADIRAYTSQAPTRLEVIASDDDPHIATAIGEDEYRTAIGLLEHHYNLILLDTGTGILDSATQGILRVADQLVLVFAPSLDGARAASLTFVWLEQLGFGHLVRGAVAVVNQSRRSGLVEVDKLEQHFLQRCRATVRVPWDPQLGTGAETGLAELAAPTRDAYLRLAAAVGDGFTATPSPTAERA